MASERLTAAESLFRHGYLDVRELVRTIAQSGLYRAKFFENCNAYRFIELNHKHLLGRAPHNRAEMLHHFTILQEQGVDAEIDSYIDSSEYLHRFGQNVVPYIHGWDYSSGHEGRQFSWLLQLARGSAASVKGSPTGNQAALIAPCIRTGPCPLGGRLRRCGSAPDLPSATTASSAPRVPSRPCWPKAPASTATWSTAANATPLARAIARSPCGSRLGRPAPIGW